MQPCLCKLAQDAIDVQDACNLSGVVRGFVRAIDDLRKLMPTLDTSGVRYHPISVLWANKIADLTGSERDMAFSHAYDWATKHSVADTVSA